MNDLPLVSFGQGDYRRDLRPSWGRVADTHRHPAIADTHRPRLSAATTDIALDPA